MKVVKKDEWRLPVKIWTEEVEDGAMEQIAHLASLPFSFHHVAIMPDVHEGYGMPIGGVLATKGVVIPNAVGVDIGCGMCAIKTPWKVDYIKDRLKDIMGRIRETVPVGFSHHKEKQDEKLMPIPKALIPYASYITNQEYNNALTQLGTLGGGNHFIEIQKDNEDDVWIMIHSGSRNFGLKVAKYYNELAKELNKKWFSGIDSKWDLAFLPLGTKEAEDYLIEMQYCLEFAFANRKLMMERIVKVFNETLDNVMYWKSGYEKDIINIHHNYVRWENHFGENVMVHRKGATFAGKDNIGIIPGSQGTKSYIVKGLGNLESFNSCSHGSGRKMSRKEATKTFNLQDEIKKMNDLGIIHGMRNESDLDECASAYKDISVVMENQKDLVEIVTELTPLAVIKG